MKKKIIIVAILSICIGLLTTGCEKKAKTNVISFRDTEDNLLMSGEVVKYAEAGEDAAGNPCIVLKISDTKKLYEVTDKISKKENNMIVIWYEYDEKKNSYELDKNNCGNLAKPSCLSAAIVSQGFDNDEILIVGSFTQEEVNSVVELINE